MVMVVNPKIKYIIVAGNGRQCCACIQGVPVMILSKTSSWFRHTHLTPRAVYLKRAVSLRSGRDYHRELSKNTGYLLYTKPIHLLYNVKYSIVVV